MKPLWINPISVVKEQARVLITRSDYDGCLKELKPGESLVIIDKGFWERAAVIPGREAWDEVYGEYLNGHTLNFNTYAVNLAVLKEHGCYWD